jgi:raffinose/stachyose/melibiose transport system permease protein
MEMPRITYKSRKVLTTWIFRLPILAILTLVIILPAISAIYYSLTDWNGIGLTAEFIGFENFKQLFEDDTYWLAFSHNITYLAIFTTVPFTLALFAASILAPIKRGGMFFRTALFIPFILPSVVTSFIWRGLLDPDLGIGLVLKNMGLPILTKAVLGVPSTALYAIAFIDNWHFWGFLMVLFLTAMQAVPPELYDAAKIDGANRWNLFRHVTFPGIRPTVLFMIMMLGIWCFMVFDWIQILTSGGPGNSTEVLSTYLYKMVIRTFEAGYGSAIGITMSLFALVIILIFTLLRRRGWEV